MFKPQPSGSSAAATDAIFAMDNLGLSATTSSNDLIIALKQQDGSTNPGAATDAVDVGIRTTTATNGGYDIFNQTSALSLTLTNQTSLGDNDSTGYSAPIYVYILSSSGAIHLAASRLIYDTGTLIGSVRKEGEVGTVTIASPGVWTVSGNNYANGVAVRLTTTGALPTGLAVNTTYYIVSYGTDGAGNFRLSATPGGSAINTTGSQSGVHTVHIADYSVVSDAFYSNAVLRLIGRIDATCSSGSYSGSPGVMLWPSFSCLEDPVCTIFGGDAAASGGAGNIIIFPTITRDTHGGYNTTTGRFRVPRAGYYMITGYIDSGEAGQVLSVYLNGSPYNAMGKTDGAGECALAGMVYCANQYDLVDIRSNGSINPTSPSIINIARVTGGF